MLYAKLHYVKNMLPRNIRGMPFTAGMSQDIVWLHDGFVKQHSRMAIHNNKTEGIIFNLCPSKYKMAKAISILKKYAMKPFIGGVNGKIGSEMTAVFYYAALLLSHCDTGTTIYAVSGKQRWNIHCVMKVATAGLEKDHQDRMINNDGIVDTLIDGLAEANAERRLLNSGWERHMKDK